MSKLSALQVRNAKPTNKAYQLPDGHGMYLHVAESGLKTWRYRFKVNGKESIFTLGEYPQMSLEQARLARMDARAMVKTGKSPTQVRKQEKKEKLENQLAVKRANVRTFENITLEWWKNENARWSKGHADAILNTLRLDVFPEIGDHPIDSILPEMILNIVRRIEDRGSLEIARKVLQRTNAVFRYAVQTGRATYNPAADMKGVLKPRKVKHHPMIMPDELPAFLQALTRTDLYITTKLAIQFTILTAARSGEVRGATWAEIDLEKRVWSIPASRMKMKVPHVVPLSNQALALLNRLKILFGDEVLVFPGVHSRSRPLSENTMLYALYRLGYHSRATMHGFRALFSTIANESGFNPDAIERQLAHREKNEVRAAYHRAEYMSERIKMMQWWADQLQQMEHES